ncbi:MAG: hypothetical protein ACRELT_11050 [Longimicrobiales bacterium]
MPASRLALLCTLTTISTASGSGIDTAPSSGSSPSPSDSAARTNIRPLPFFYDLFTFRGRGGSTAIVTAFAVEAGKLETETADRRVRYRFSVTLVLADTALGSVSNTHDTVFVDVRRPLADDHLLYTHVEVLAPPSGTTRQRVIMTDATQPGIGQLYSDRFPIPDYSGNHLMLSDIALGQPDARTGWRRGDVTLALLPTTQFPSSAFDVYYEIYNLPAGHHYTTEIVIERADRSGTGRAPEAEPVRLRFGGESAAGPDAMLPELRRVESSLSRGSYRLTVNITDLNTGATASRSRAFEVRGWERGATMVAALPSAHGGGSR